MRITKDTADRFCNETGLQLMFGKDKSGDIFTYSEFVKRNRTIEKAIIVIICGWDKSGRMIYKEYSAPKAKEVTLDWLMHKLEKSSDRVYQNLRKIFKSLLPENSMRFYVTSYGIGFDTFCLSDDKVKECTKFLSDYMNRNNIKFRNEYSQAYWVYRFVIGQSKENIDIINSLAK